MKKDFNKLKKIKVWPDEYFKYRDLNDPLRVAQYKLDSIFIRKFINSGNICDVGCGTGEFLRYLKFNGNLYGMETNLAAKKKASNFISFNKNIYTEKNYFDLVIFRGTIQHVDTPFLMIKKAYESLKEGGYVIFLATPNADSILYRLKKNLHFLEDAYNFYIPSEKTLINALRNFSFKIQAVEFPYWNTPYRNFFKDHFFFLLNLFSRKFYKHAFWGSSMNICAKKNTLKSALKIL